MREIDLSPAQKADLLSHSFTTMERVSSQPTPARRRSSHGLQFGEMLGGRFDEHPWGIIDAPVLVEDHTGFPGMANLPPTFQHIDEYYQFKDFSRRARSRVLLRLDVSHLEP